MSISDHNRQTVLAEAERWASALRRAGYPEAEVAPEYCIGGEIAGGYFTRTVSVYAGQKVPPTPPRPPLWRRLVNYWRSKL